MLNRPQPSQQENLSLSSMTGGVAAVSAVDREPCPHRSDRLKLVVYGMRCSVSWSSLSRVVPQPHAKAQCSSQVHGVLSMHSRRQPDPGYTLGQVGKFQ